MPNEYFPAVSPATFEISNDRQDNPDGADTVLGTSM